jgi:hypothetical protein
MCRACSPIARRAAVVISYDHADTFPQAVLADLAEHDRRRAIRVTSAVIREADQARTRVNDLGRLPMKPATHPRKWER